GHGNISMLQATEGSVNTAYAQINAEVGPEATEEMAIRLGLPEDTTGLEPVISNVLGSASPHVVDMARAYSTIAAGGDRTTPHIVAEVTDSQQNVRYSGPTESTSVLDPQVAADATYAMSQVVQHGTGSTASELGRPAAGKTGSSQNYRSAWFVGFVPQLTTAVALDQPGEDGTEEQLSPIGDVNIVAGGTWPTTIWTEYMKQAVDGMPVEDFPERSAPVRPSYAPRPEPTREPSEEPSQEPSEEPTEEPTQTPGPTPTTPTPSPTPATPTPTPSDGDDTGSDGSNGSGGSSGSDGSDGSAGDSDGSGGADPGGGDSAGNQGR